MTFTVEQYAEAKVKAKELGINFVGKTKQALVDLVNAAIESKETIEAKATEDQGTAEEVAEKQDVVEETSENQTSTQEQEVKENQNQTEETGNNEETNDANTENKNKGEKWYANGYGYSEGDKIEIIAKDVVRKGKVEQILQGRKAVVVGPSKKKNNLNAYLVEERTGKVLNCLITFELDKVAPYKEEQQVQPANTESEQTVQQETEQEEVQTA